MEVSVKFLSVYKKCRSQSFLPIITFNIKRRDLVHLVINKIVCLLICFSNNSYALVNGPEGSNAGKKSIRLSSQMERGKVEPNENKTSFQSAQIDLFKLRYVQDLESLFGLSGSNIFLEYGIFNSSKEQVGSTLFYKKDSGSYFSLGISRDLLASQEKNLIAYFQFSPLRSYNKDKFSNPRLDSFALGLASSFEVTSTLFQRSLIHIGSGDGSDQNSYLVLDLGFGYRLNHLVKWPFTVLGSLFMEADTSERKDPLYDIAFSPTGTQDRIRSSKYGTLFGAEISLTQRSQLHLAYLQKLGGYDARATQVYTAELGYNF